MKKVLGIGNALADMIVFMESDEMLHELNIPKGSMQLVDKELSLKIKTITSTSERHFESGGSAANTIHGLARLGVETGFIGTVGNDETGDFFISDMEKSGINSHILRGKLPTGLAISLVSPDSERTFATYLGSASEIKNEGIDKVIFSRYNHLHLEGYLVQDQNMFANAVMLAKECGLSVSLDLASYNVVEANIDFLVDIITKGIDLVFANENEAHALTGKADPEEALFSISAMCRTAVVKTGPGGSLIMEGGKIYHISPVPADCKDTTGAGDLYASGYLYGLTRNWSPEKCGRAGSLLAARVIEVPGAKISDKGWKEIFARI